MSTGSSTGGSATRRGRRSDGSAVNLVFQWVYFYVGYLFRGPEHWSELPGFTLPGIETSQAQCQSLG